MKSTDLSCVLRTLTLCDGHEVVESAARLRRVDCYCARLATAEGFGSQARCSQLRTDRARQVARAEGTLARLERDRRYGPPIERF